MVWCLVGSRSRFCSRARVAAARRLATPSLSRILATWALTVRWLTNRAAAISRSVQAWARRRKTSCSRGVSTVLADPVGMATAAATATTSSSQLLTRGAQLGELLLPECGASGGGGTFVVVAGVGRIVAPASCASKSIPPRSIAAGSPAGAHWQVPPGRRVPERCTTDPGYRPTAERVVIGQCRAVSVPPVARELGQPAVHRGGAGGVADRPILRERLLGAPSGQGVSPRPYATALRQDDASAACAPSARQRSRACSRSTSASAHRSWLRAATPSTWIAWAMISGPQSARRRRGRRGPGAPPARSSP